MKDSKKHTNYFCMLAGAVTIAGVFLPYLKFITDMSNPKEGISMFLIDCHEGKIILLAAVLFIVFGIIRMRILSVLAFIVVTSVTVRVFWIYLRWLKRDVLYPELYRAQYGMYVLFIGCILMLVSIIVDKVKTK